MRFVISLESTKLLDFIEFRLFLSRKGCLYETIVGELAMQGKWAKHGSITWADGKLFGVENDHSVSISFSRHSSSFRVIIPITNTLFNFEAAHIPKAHDSP